MSAARPTEMTEEGALRALQTILDECKWPDGHPNKLARVYADGIATSVIREALGWERFAAALDNARAHFDN